MLVAGSCLSVDLLGGRQHLHQRSPEIQCGIGHLGGGPKYGVALVVVVAHDRVHIAVTGMGDDGCTT